MKEKPERFRAAGIIRALQIPEDFSRGNVIVGMQGRERVNIENFKGISSYTEAEIRLITKCGKICISGKNLKIENYTKEEIEISGRIDCVGYQ